MDREVIGARSDAAAQLRTQFFGDLLGIRTITNDLRTDEDDQLRSSSLLVLVGEGIAQARDWVHSKGMPLRYFHFCISLISFGQQHGLTIRDRNRAFHPPLGYRRRQAFEDCGETLLIFLFPTQGEDSVANGQTAAWPARYVGNCTASSLD